jgi:uncharacterized protein YggE
MRRFLIALPALALVACGTSADETTAPETSSAPTTVATTASEVSVAPPNMATTAVTEVAVTPATRPAPAAEDPATPVPSPEPVDVAVRSITVGGMGAEYSEPARCTVDIGVTARRPTVGESGDAAAISASAMTEALLASGVRNRDIQTSQFNVNTYYDNYPTIAGYETHIGYRVTMPDVDGVGSVLAAAIDAGGDDVRAWGIRFEADPTGLMDAAREAAWADVMARAESLAALAGEPLGEMLDAHEKVLVSTTQGMYQGGEGDSATFDIPVSPGVSGVVVLLTVTFAIGE